MHIERIDHIHIAVKDLKAAANVFSERMGTQFWGPRDTGYGFKVAFDNLGLELQESTSPGNRVEKHIEEHGEGLSWIAFKVTDIDEAVAELRAKGIPVHVQEKPLGPIKHAIIEDSEKTYGVVIQFVKYEELTPICVTNFRKTTEIPKM